MTKDEARDILKNLNTAHVGDTLFLFDEVSRALVEGQMRKKMNAGETKFNKDGSREFIDVRVIIDTEKQGSEQFIWDASGNKVKHNRVKVTIHKNGDITEEHLGTCWRIF